MDENEIEITLEASDDQTELAVVLRSNGAITTSDLIVTLEGYLMELTRAEAGLRMPGMAFH